MAINTLPTHDAVRVSRNSLTLLLSLFFFASATFSVLFPDLVMLVDDCEQCIVPFPMYAAIVLAVSGLLNLYFYLNPDLPEKKSLIFFCALLLSLFALGLSSEEVYMSDSYEHFLISKYSPSYPALFLDMWNRPFFTLLTFLPAMAGMFFVRLLNVLLSLGTVYFIHKCAVKLNLDFKESIPLLSVSVPFFLLVGTSALTEMSMAFFFSLGLYLLLSGSRLKAAIAFSSLPFFRPEGFVVLALTALYFLMRREYRPALLSAAIPGLMNLIGFLATGQIFWLITSSPYFDGNYESFPIYYFALQLPMIVGPFLVLPFMAGLANSYKEKVMALLASSFLAVVLIYSYMLFTGKFVNIILLRVFISLLPAILLLALYGISMKKYFQRPAIALFLLLVIPAIFFSETLVLKGLTVIALGAAILWMLPVDKKSMALGAAAVALLLIHIPQPLNTEHFYAKETAEFLTGSNISSFYTDHPAVHYFTGTDFIKQSYPASRKRAVFSDGDVLVWDAHFSAYRFSRKDLMESNEWEVLATFGKPGKNPQFIVARKPG